jgi:hypothetical protein
MALTTDTKQHEELHRKYLEAVQQSYPTTTLPYLAQQAPATFTEAPRINLNEGAWDIPVSQLVDLWVVRYGSRWVKHEELDEFYSIAATRLDKIHKLETHYLNGTNVYRIVE